MFLHLPADCSRPTGAHAIVDLEIAASWIGRASLRSSTQQGSQLLAYSTGCDAFRPTATDWEDMARLSTGGGTSAVAASTHAGCERFRRTDPMVIGVGRRQLAEHLGFPDTTGTIPEARRQRANIFERLVRAEEFVSPLITKAVGAIAKAINAKDLPRPAAVRRANCGINRETTASALQSAHEFAVSENSATLLTDLALPFVGFEDEPDATPVKPDFAIVSARLDEDGDIVGSWLIMGDAKDYELSLIHI